MIRYWARIEMNETTLKWEVIEVIDFNPVGNYHPSLIWVECTDVVEQGFTYDEKTGVFTSADELYSVNMPLTISQRVASVEEMLDTLFGGS